MKVKKLLAGILSAAMVLGTMSFSVFAEENYVAQIDETKYTTMEDAMKNANGKTVTLLANATLKGGSWKYSEPTTVELDGHTLTLQQQGNGSEFTFGNLTISGDDKRKSNINFDLFSSVSESLLRVGDHTSAVRLKLSGLTVNAPQEYKTGLGLLGVNSKSALELENVTIKAAEGSKVNDTCCDAIFHGEGYNCGNTLKIKDVNVINVSNDELISQFTNVDIDDLQFKGTINEYLISCSNGSIKNSSFEYTNDSTAAVVRDYKGMFSVTLDFENTEIKNIPTCTDGNVFAVSNANAKLIADPTSSFTDVSGAAVGADKVKTGVAELDGKLYESLDEAVAAVTTDGKTIKLLGDVNATNNKKYYAKELTYDLNGHEMRLKPIENYDGEVNVGKNITFTSSADKKGVINISDANVGGSIWYLAENITMSFNNVTLFGTIKESACGVFVTTAGLKYTDTTPTVKFNKSIVNLSAESYYTDNGRLATYANVEANDSEITLDKFDGGFAGSNKATFTGNTSVTVKNGGHACSRCELVMKDNSSLTAQNCAEGAIKLDKGAAIILEDYAQVNVSGTTTGILYRNDPKMTEADRASVKISVAQTATLNATIDEEVAEKAQITGKALAISVEFKKASDKVYEIVLVAPTATKIHEFTTAQFKFTKDNKAIGYEIAEADDGIISVNEQADGVYLFNLKDGKNIVGDENSVVIGKVIFDGFSDKAVNFKVDTAYDDNRVIATKGSNITDTFTVQNGKLTVNGVIDESFEEPKCEVTVNVTMTEPVTDNAKEYQSMKVVISGQSLEEPIVCDLGTDGVKQDGGKYTITKTLNQDKRYVITVSGAGYRTAKHTLNTNEKETATVNFWNNVNPTELVMENGDTPVKAYYNFIAGDIIKDNKLNIYDLSAVVAYFGEKGDTKTAWNKVKYDLDRNGVIDARDVSIVLNAWKALEALNAND